ncbi:hypothetical protein Barb4_01230 [Bacteroidales bacterium Barb4]|nr:hypothetical protein Barb4_01230 [Bacteroidales bacterium Barb4]
MFHSRPERTADFSPTWSVAECGVKGDADKEVLKGRPDNVCGILLSFVACIMLSALYWYVFILKPNVPLRFTLG